MDNTLVWHLYVSVSLIYNVIFLIRNISWIPFFLGKDHWNILVSIWSKEAVIFLWFNNGLMCNLTHLLVQNFFEKNISNWYWIIFKFINGVSAFLYDLCYQLLCDTLGQFLLNHFDSYESRLLLVHLLQWALDDIQYNIIFIIIIGWAHYNAIHEEFVDYLFNHFVQSNVSVYLFLLLFKLSFGEELRLILTLRLLDRWVYELYITNLLIQFTFLWFLRPHVASTRCLVLHIRNTFLAP